MTPSSATLDEKALEAANAAFSEAHNVPQQCYDCAGTGRHSDESTCRTCEGNGWVAPKGWDPMASAIRAYMSALTVTSFPPAEQHDVTSHAVPHDGEGAVAPFAWAWKWASGGEWRLFGAETSEAARADFIRDMERTAPIVVKAVYDHPAPVAAQPAEGWVTVPREPTEAMVEAGIDALREHTELMAIARDPLFVWRYMLSALPANSSERQKALDAAAALVDGWTTAANTRHLQGWGVHTNAVADMLAKRDAEIATAIRALATNPNSSEGEPR